VGRTSTKPDICPACGRQNELPFVFCGQCGAGAIRISKTRVMYSVSLVFLAVMGAVYFRDFLLTSDGGGWLWPLYLLIAVFFTRFTAALARGQLGYSLELNLWCTIFLGGFFGFYMMFHLEMLGILFVWLEDAPRDALARPGLYGGAAGGILLALFLPLYFHLRRLYGWVNTYRILLLGLLVLALLLFGLLHILQSLHDSDLFRESLTGLGDFLREQKAAWQKFLVLFASTVFRLFLFEIAVFSAVRGLVLTRGIRAASPTDPEMQKESGFQRSLLHITQAINRLLLALDSMVHYLFQTLLLLSKDLLEVIAAFLRKIAVPALALSAAAVLIHTMAGLLDSYLLERNLDSLLKLGAVLPALIFCALLFLACNARVRWTRILTFYSQLIGWLLPNLLVFFLLLSVSLYLSSAVYNRYINPEHQLPFRIGILTKSVAILLLTLIVITFIRRRALLGGAESRKTQEAVKGAADESGGGRTAVPGTVPQKGAALGLARSARAILDTGRDLTDRLKGKPAIVDQLTRARAGCKEKVAEIRALEQTRASISPDTYQELRAQYEKDLAALENQRGILQPQVDKMHAEALVKRQKALADQSECLKRLEETERLRQAGALGERDYKKRTTEWSARLRIAEAQLKEQEKMLGFLAPQASSAGGQGPLQERKPSE